LFSAAGSWGGGPAGGYPTIGLDHLSNPGYNAGMVSLALKNNLHPENSKYIEITTSSDCCVEYSS